MKSPAVPTRTPKAANSVQQQRSRETLTRILESAESLLRTREFDELTMIDLAEHAGCAVGTVYGRVTDKETLLLCLHERSTEAGLTAAGRVFDRYAGEDLEGRVRAVCGLMVDFFTTHHHVIRAVTNFLYARPSDDRRARVARLRRDTTRDFRQAAAFLAERVDRRVHSSPASACEFALLAAHDVVQGRVVYGTHSGLTINYTPGTLKARVTALVLAYLQHG